MKTSHLARLLIASIFATAAATNLVAQEEQAPPAAESGAELISQIHPRYFSSYSNPLTRNPAILLRFNAAMDPDAVSDLAYIIDSKGKRLKVVAAHPTPEEALPLQDGNYSDADPHPLDHFVRLQPGEPLPFDQKWVLIVSKGLTNIAATHRSTRDIKLNLGTIRRFEISGTYAISPYEGGRRLDIRLNKRLPDDLTAEQLANFVSIYPKPGDLRMSKSNNRISVHGDFVLDQSYRVTVQPGLVSKDETRTERTYRHSLIFEPGDPFVSLPAFSAPQLSSGDRQFKINTGNLENLEVRVKQLDDRDLLYALRGYDAYNGDRVIPFEMVPGHSIWNEEIEALKEFDRIQTVTLNWGDVLKNPDTETAPAAASPAALYICAEGDSKLSKDGRRYGAQAIIQLTDIGLAWKRDRSHDLVYAFSLASGEPLANVSLELINNDTQPLRKATTDAHGLARLPRIEDLEGSRWLLAKLADDRHVMDLNTIDNTIGLWRFGVPYRYQGNKNDTESRRQLGRRTFVFTDRPVYKPGDEVYVKSHTRLTDFDSLLPADADHDSDATARLRVYDTRRRTVLDTRLSVSEFGSLEHHFTLPEEGLGRYRLELDFNPEGIDRDAKPHRNDLVFNHSLLVAEYRPNTFEITLTPPVDPDSGTAIDIPVAAAYFMGKPLSKARLQWHAFLSPWQPQAKGFEDFSFAYHDGLLDTSFSEEFDLAADGTGSIPIDLPSLDDHPTPLHVSLDAEITDINQQTVAAATEFIIHSADHYFGIRTPDETGRENQPSTFEIAAIDRDGQPLADRSVTGKLRIEKKIRYTVKVRGAGDAIATRSRVRYEPVYETQLDITTSNVDPDTGKITGTSHDFTPGEAGDYVVTITSEDDNGKLLTAASANFKVIGEEDRDWNYRDQLRLTLTPEKELYQPGDTARLFLDTPVLGTALVSIERNHVRETFIHPITKNRDVLEIPVPADGAPNLFVSVLVIRGAADSPHKHRAAAFRLGYAQIDIDDPSREISIDLQPSQTTYEPADAIDVAAIVSDAEGKPLANTELTLYAVDEGVLSLTGYTTPDPDTVLNAPYELNVATGQNLTSVLSDDPDLQYFGNKGYVIGGGGPAMKGIVAAPDQRVRKNFKTLAFWQGSLITDRNGRVQASFTAPDNLTEYRLIAVAAKGDRFAAAETPITIHQPLIVEPALPAFANVGDRIELRAVLHNNTPRSLTLNVSLDLDESADFAAEPLPKIIPAQLQSANNDGGRVTSLTRKIELAAGETSALTFPVCFKNVGTAKWKWRAVASDEPELNDSVETTLDVGYPLPLLRESHHVTLTDTSEDKDADIISRISPHLLNGRGRVDITVSNSRLIEAQDALDYLLKYPYGCVEQTTSSTLPWLSTQNLRDALPSLKKTDEEIAAAISGGARRLLSMQTQDGGLSYWPGSSEPVLWGSAYGGMAVALAAQSGTDLPDDSLDALWSYLSKNLRNTGDIKNPYDLSQRCLALYTLALAGKAEPAYHDLLYQRRDDLPDEARALLALAIIESGSNEGDDSRVPTLLADSPGAPKSKVTWYGAPYTYATRILAWSRYAPNSDANQRLIDDLLALRKGPSAWGSTYSNAWPLLAITTHARSSLSDLSEASVDVTFDQRTQHLDLADRIASGATDFHFDGDLREASLTLQQSGSTPLYAHIEIESLPDLVDTKAINHGFDITRQYQKIAPNGDLSPATELTVGDLVLITLDMTLPEKQTYLAIDDPLPAIFEAVNPEFKTQTQQDAPQSTDGRKRLYTSHQELRKDRALFFCDYNYRAGDYQIQYLARVAATGEATAPAAKIEAMYEPQRYGLSATERVTARSVIPDADDEARARSEVAAR